MEDLPKKFNEFLKEICPNGEANGFVWTVEGENPPLRKKVKIYTNDHCYSIVARVKENGNTYLGCVVSTRKPRAGEDWTRGRDLSDGVFCRETWENIKNDILSHELVKVAINSENPHAKA